MFIEPIPSPVGFNIRFIWVIKPAKISTSVSPVYRIIPSPSFASTFRCQTPAGMSTNKISAVESDNRLSVPIIVSNPSLVRIASTVTTSEGAFTLSIYNWIFPLSCSGEIGLSLFSFEHPQKTNVLKRNVRITFFIAVPFCQIKNNTV